MFSFFKKEKQASNLPTIDVHSHLLPGIDDGVNTVDESLEIIKQFSEMGYEKIITTPHVMSDFYPNNREIIMDKLEQVKSAMVDASLSIELEAAAEYYFDEHFINLVQSKQQLLTFGDRYVLFEIGFMSEPMNLKTIIFDLITQGYHPVLAHPERYIYYSNEFEKLEDLVSRGVLLQLNLNSLTGYYSKEAKGIAQKLIDKDMISFVGSDCHNQKHFDQMKLALGHKLFRKLSENNLLNHTL